MPKPFVAWIALSFFLLLGLSTIQAQTPSTAPTLKDPEALLEAARTANGLDGDDLKPWHLKVNYDVFDAYGKPVTSGVFEEWWAGKDKWKRSYTSSHYTGTFYHLPEGNAYEGDKEKDVPWPESLIPTHILSPINVKKDLVNFTGDKGPYTLAPPKMEITTLPGKFPLSCVTPLPSLTNQGPDPFGTYCFQPGSAELRMSNVDYLESIYNKMGLFQGRAVGLELSITCNQRPVINAHLTTLGTMPNEDPSIFTTKTALIAAIPGNSTKSVPAGVLAGRKISGGNPSYPDFSKRNGDQGVVILGAIINKHGEIENLKVLESPSQILSGSSMTTVQKWKYQPYLLNGNPVDVETTINVVFNLGR